MTVHWIPIYADLPYKPEVAQIANHLQCSTDEVVGILIRFSCWAQAHCSARGFPEYTPDDIAKSAKVSMSFIDAMVSVGWFEITAAGTVIPRFERWCSDLD